MRAVPSTVVGWLAFVALMVGLSGCLTPALDEATVAQESLGFAGTPEFELLYYPYTVSLSRQITEPHPLYDGWNDIRMRFDTRRLARSGIDLLVVNVEPESSMTSDERTIQYRRFADYASQAGLPFCLQADVTGLSVEQLEAFLDWVVRLNLQEVEVVLRRENRPVLRLLNASHNQQQVDHIGLSLDYERWVKPDGWQDLAPALAEAQINAERSAILVYAGLTGGDPTAPPSSWLLPRDGGRTLRHGLLLAVSLNPDRVVIDSWNNFTNGSFIQPNMLDSAELERSLVETLSEIATENR